MPSPRTTASASATAASGCARFVSHAPNRIWLGTYPTPEMAARAHDVGAIALRGNSAQLNFSDSFSTLPRPESASADDIRRAASHAVHMGCTSHPVATSLKNDSGDANDNGNGITTCERLMEMASDHKPPSTPASVTSRPMPVSVFVDEEELFNSPGLLNSMAKGMLLTPPAMQPESNWDGMDCEVELSPWNDDQL